MKMPQYGSVCIVGNVVGPDLGRNTKALNIHLDQLYLALVCQLVHSVHRRAACQTSMYIWLVIRAHGLPN